MTTFTLAERWPFMGGEALYYLPNNHSRIYPMPCIPATVLACHQMHGNPHATVSIRRDDKPRPSSVSASSLVYRGHCAGCEVPAIVGDGGALICPRCSEAAIALPPPDHLVVRWYPDERWTWPMTMRRQVEHPTWSWSAAREAAEAPHAAAYDDMLRRMQLRRLYVSSDWSIETAEDRRYEYRLLTLLKAAAILRDDALFLATHQELSARQAEASRSRYLAQRLRQLDPERLREIAFDLLDTSEADEPPPSAPPTVSLIPLPERPESDAEPDGEDELTRWVAEQLRKRAA